MKTQGLGASSPTWSDTFNNLLDATAKYNLQKQQIASQTAQAQAQAQAAQAALQAEQAQQALATQQAAQAAANKSVSPVYSSGGVSSSSKYLPFVLIGIPAAFLLLKYARG